jgi:FkbM family methyltransferase
MNSASDAFIPHIGWLSHEPGDELISLLRQGYFEAAEQAFFWLYLRPGDWFFDCGAHIGLYSVLASRATTGQSHIFCVEASPTTADYLERNLMRNEVHGARVFRRALWKDSGVVPFVSEGLGRSAYAHVANEGHGQSKMVQAITLDELVSLSEAEEISLVKIDVEGAEPDALQGARVAAAARSLPVIMIEFTERNLQRRGASSDQLVKQLYQLGYELCEFSSETLELVAYRPDGPIWYKNLFACLNPNSVNLRLKSAVPQNRNIAMDILERGSACSRFKELDAVARLGGENRAHAHR